MSKHAQKSINWVSSAKRDPDGIPEDGKDVFGHAIDLAQAGGKHPEAKVRTGVGAAGVLENLSRQLPRIPAHSEHS